MSDQSALLVGDVGRVAILVACAGFVVSFLLSLAKKDKFAGWAFALGCVGIFASFAALATLFVNDQFIYRYVASHSERGNAIQYKVASVWSGQQGSFLLWGITSAFFAWIARKGTGSYKNGYTAVCSAFLASLCGILMYESPYLLNLDETGKIFLPADGLGLAPALHNYWVVIHPPTIFLGFGSLIVLFAYAVSALANKDFDDWGPRARPWSILSATLTGLGLCMGGFWAYDMLGWGGFWMWDPVENASFVPWMLTLALIHGLIVQATRRKWHFTNLLLAGAPFLSFIYGTFLTRSGFMSEVSVHSFAKMEETALVLLRGVLFFSVIGFLGFWGFRMFRAPKPEIIEEKGLRRDSFYRWGMSLLSLMAVATAIGMSVPLFQALRGQTAKVVEEHQYHLILSWFFIPTMLLMGAAPFVSWRAMSGKELFNRLFYVGCATLFATGISLIFINHPTMGVQPDPKATVEVFQWGSRSIFVKLTPWMAFLIGTCWWVGLANLWRLAETFPKSKMGVGSFVSHVGLAIALAGLMISRGYERKQNYVLRPGSTAVGLELNGPRHTIGMVPGQDFDFGNRENVVPLAFKGDGQDFTAKPGLYYNFPQGQEPQPMMWPWIQRWLSHDIYVVLHPLQPETPASITLKPGESGELTGPLWDSLAETTYKIKYDRFVREGAAGTRGTKFGAELSVTRDEGEVQKVTPKMVVGELQPEAANLDDDFQIVMRSMDAATRSVELGLRYTVPVFPVDTFYKPMTILVWIGVGVMTLGGFMSAFYRRHKPRPTPPLEPQRRDSDPSSESLEEENALVTTA